jgi:GDP-D-mannose dehydratase
VIAMIQELSGHDFDVTVNPAFVRANEVKMLWGDRSKIENLIGQRPIHDLRGTLAWMLEG